jgi:hypothetical protein
MLKCIAFVLTFTPIFVSEAKTQQTSPVMVQILRNHPSIDREYARDIASAIYKAATEHRLRPERLAAILAQESMYTLNAVNKKSKDFGIAQINWKTVERYGFDKKRLLTDLEYSVKAGAIVLADFKRMYGKREKNYWSRYNSSDEERRKEYEFLVARYM